MAENKDGQEKTEQATKRRIDDGRDRGQVAKSIDVTTAAILLFGGTSVFIIGGPFFSNYRGFMSSLLHNSSQLDVTYQNVLNYYPSLLGYISLMLVPIMLLIFAITLTSEISQVGLKVATKKFSELEDLKKIFRIGAGLKKIFFSSRSIFELIKNFAKIFVLGIVIYSTIAGEFDTVVSISEKPYQGIGPYMVSLALEILIKVGVLYIIIAISDYIFQKWKFSQDMKMTKQEVKDEQKQQEGDPKVKSQLRALMKSRIRSLMVDNVKDADVVVTNPTHFAVALKYSQGNMNSPIVVAKGLDFIAKQIRDKAEEHNVIIYEDPPLARTLFYSVDVEQEIPETLFKAVAQVLAYVYSIKGEK